MRDIYDSGRNQAQVEIEGLRHEKQQIQQVLDQRVQELATLVEHSRAADARAKKTEQHYHNVLAEAEAALADQGDEIARLVAEFKQAKIGHPDPALYPLSQADVTTLSPQEMRENRPIECQGRCPHTDAPSNAGTGSVEQENCRAGRRNQRAAD